MKCYISIAVTNVDLEGYYDCSFLGEFGFTRAEFAAILRDVLQRSVPSGTARECDQVLAGLRIRDLLLARACARGHEAAWSRFLLLYREKLYRAAAAIAKENSLAHELADSLYANLYGTRVQDDGRRICKLDSYLGRGSLEGWLRTLLAQAFVDRFREQRKFVSFEETAETGIETAEERPGPAQHSQIARATDTALDALSPEERLLLAAYYLDGRTLAEIGRLLAVHESTISRRLEKLIATLRKQVISNLRAGGMSKDEAQQMLELDVRDLEVDVKRRLAQDGRVQERTSGTI